MRVRKSEFIEVKEGTRFGGHYCNACGNDGFTASLHTLRYGFNPNDKTEVVLCKDCLKEVALQSVTYSLSI